MDIKKSSEIELKAFAFDALKEIERLQRMVVAINQELQERESKPKSKD